MDLQAFPGADRVLAVVQMVLVDGRVGGNSVVAQAGGSFQPVCGTGCWVGTGATTVGSTGSSGIRVIGCEGGLGATGGSLSLVAAAGGPAEGGHRLGLRRHRPRSRSSSHSLPLRLLCRDLCAHGIHVQAPHARDHPVQLLCTEGTGL